MKVKTILKFYYIFSSLCSPVFSQGWSPLPFLTKQSKTAGNPGGEGCQVISNIAIDGTGNILLMGTDVGGIYKSTDGGINWQPCNKGFKPRGSAYTAIDPNNSNRFIVVGGNSSAWDWHGIWLSTDQGESWANTLPKNHGIDAAPGRGYNMIAYDPSSLTAGKTNIIYWSAPTDVSNGGGLFKSSDGGLTWTNLNTTMGGSFIAVHPTKGYLYVGNSNGLYKSTNGGTSFTQLLTTAILGLAVTKANPDWLYIVRSFDIELSKDAGATWVKKSGNGLPTSASNGGPGWTRIHCSPVNSNLLTITHETGTWYDVPAYRSKDGGNNWSKPNISSNYVFFPANIAARIERPAFHPLDSNIIVSCSGDWICRSTDGGNNYIFSNNGNNGAMGGYFNFNPFHSDVMLICTQDYNSAITVDAGGTWKYLNVSGQGWGGFNYGGYAFNSKTMFTGNASGWSNPRFLYTSFDGGQTWANTNIQGSGSDVACPCPVDSNIAFWDDYRTTDQGKNWNQMTGCEGVYTYNPTGTKELYGRKGGAVVKSTDKGVSWTTLFTISGETVGDIAFDQTKNRVYATTSSRKLFTYDVGTSTLTEITNMLPSDNGNNKWANNVAVDPNNPSHVIASVHSDIYATNMAVVYSPDGGVTWSPLTKQATQQGLDGGHEPGCIKINPATGDLWVTGECYGVWKYSFTSATGIVSANNNSTFTIYPNPANDYFMVDRTSANSEIELYDVLGNKIWTQLLQTGNTKIDLSGFNRGMYFFKIISGDRAFQTGKLIKE